MIVRLTLAALFVIPAVMAYPWQSTFERWLLGVAVALVVVLFARWRGLFVTTLVARRLRLLTRRSPSLDDGAASGSATVTLRLEPRDVADLPLALAAGYLDRYGIRFDKVRITSRDVADARTTWVSLTLDAAQNLAALSARSPRIPLHDTAQLAARRLADHLRELGWEVTADDAPAAPMAEDAKEAWRGVTDGRGYLAAYRVAVHEGLQETLDAVRAIDTAEVWCAVELTGGRGDPDIAAACALRTSERPSAIAGLTAERGLHRSALDAMNPASPRRLLASPVRATPDLLDQLHWPVGARLSRT